MTFRGRNAKKITLTLNFNETPIAETTSFKFLGLYINYSLTWGDHIRHISTKISRGVGILNRFKHIFPTRILITLFHSLIGCYTNNHIISWGKDTNTITLLHKKSLRIIFNRDYYAHSSPLFVAANSLKPHDIYKLSLLKHYRRFLNFELPSFFMNLNIKTNKAVSSSLRSTRYSTKIAVPHAHHSEKDNIKSLSFNYKKVTLKTYPTKCMIKKCFSCKRIDSLSLEF